MHFENYPLERLYIDSIDSRLSPEAKHARLSIMNFTIENGRPFNTLSDASADVMNAIEELKGKRAAVIDAKGEVDFIYPVSAKPTNHMVRLSDGRKFSAMCAIDAMGAAFTFHCDTVVESLCAQCGTPVRVEVRDGLLSVAEPRTLHALHVDLNKNQDWSTSC